MLALDIPLTDFEQATLEQLVSFKAVKEKDIERLINDTSLQQEVIRMVASWDKQRIEKGLNPWNS